MPLRRTLAISAALLAAACDRVPSQALTECQQALVIPARVETDILFVVDDSGSMFAEQQALAGAFQGFIDQLAASPVANDFQIGITTTSVDWPICDQMDGAGNCTQFHVQTSYASGVPYAAGALVAAPGHPRILRAGSPTLVPDFVANINVGIVGSWKEQGLRAMQLALSDRIADGQNAGFLRPGARLAVILVTDEDDCSEFGTPQIIFPPNQDGCHTPQAQALLPPVQGFVNFMRGPLAGQVRPFLVAALAAVDPVTKQPVAPACNSAGYPAYRYREFLDAFAPDAFADDVCQPDFGTALGVIAALLDPGQTMPLSGAPPDWRLLQVRVTKAAGGSVACTVGLPGASPQAAQVLYRAPQGGQGPALTFQGACALEHGDSVQVRILCAG